VAVVGGLAFSQLITLFVTPVVYTYMDALSHRASRRLARFGRKRADDTPPVPIPAAAAVAKLEARPVTSSGDAAD
jgi:hypothetical protein